MYFTERSALSRQIDKKRRGERRSVLNVKRQRIKLNLGPVRALYISQNEPLSRDKLTRSVLLRARGVLKVKWQGMKLKVKWQWMKFSLGSDTNRKSNLPIREVERLPERACKPCCLVRAGACRSQKEHRLTRRVESRNHADLTDYEDQSRADATSRYGLLRDHVAARRRTEEGASGAWDQTRCR